MSFKPEIDRASIFNEALALLPSDPVQDTEEISVEARECRRFYKGVVGSLLEMHHWSLATKRVLLAEIANDRSTEWPYAFAKPVDMAYPTALLDVSSTAYAGWVYSSYAYLLNGSRLFMQVGNTIYSRVRIATLEYSSFDITEGDFTALLKDIIVLGLAERICIPITKDEQRAQQLSSRYEMERSRVIANDLNRNQPTWGNKPTETEMVRGAAIDYNSIGGYPLDPVANAAVTGFDPPVVVTPSPTPSPSGSESPAKVWWYL